MSEQTQRQRRIADGLRQGLMDILQHKLRDKVLRQVTITTVFVAKDLSSARIFYVLLNPNSDDDTLTHVKHTLKRLAGYLRHQLAQCMLLRKVPHLNFCYDEQIIKSQQLSTLIDQAIQHDDPNSDTA